MLFIMYHSEVSRISSIQFGLSSPEEIRNESVAEISKLIAYEKDGKPSKNGLFDTRMGPSSRSEKCETDGLSSDETPGYFGHIELSLPVFNHAHIGEVNKVLHCVCNQCGNRLIKLIGEKGAPTLEEAVNGPSENRPYPVYEEFMKLPGNKRLSILNNMKFDKVCSKCNFENPKKYELNRRSVDSIDANYDGKYSPIYPEYVYRVFQKITIEDCKVLGFNPPHSHPSSLVLHAIPVCPPLVRPSVQQGTGMVSQDNITTRYEELLKSNNIAAEASDSNQERIDTHREFVADDVATLFDNDPAGGFQPKPKNAPMPHQTFAQRIKGKEPKTGRIRGNLMSRRVEMSARSVITPDPMIDLDEIGIPKAIAMNVTFPEKVNKLNIHELYKCVDNGPDKYPGAEGVIRKGSINTQKITKDMILEIGDTVIRHLRDGDLVIMNRQPSLHKKSMMGHRVRVLPGYSFRLNVNVTEPYNADFDGDEMNMHCPQSIATVNEALTLAGLKNQSMSPASNTPAIAFIQDNVLAAYNMTYKDDKNPRKIAFTRRELMNALARDAPFYFGILDKNEYYGTEVLDLFTPNYSNKLQGVIKKGDLVKIVSDTYHQEGIAKCFAMSDNLQKLLIEYMNKNSYSVGPADILRDGVNEEVDLIANNLMNKVNNKIRDVHSCKCSTDEKNFEEFVSGAIADATLSSEKLLEEAEQRRFNALIKSKSKGKKKNISQMKGFIGQQIVNGSRTSTGYSNRTLPHFNKYNENIKTRGFIRNSFSTGLHPYEFFFHAAGGREGLIEQALQTGQTGYIQRQMIKTLEDLTVGWNNAVNDSQGNVVQFLYGDDHSMGESIEVQDLKSVLNSSYEKLEVSHSLTKDSIWKRCVSDEALANQDDSLLSAYYEDFLHSRKQYINRTLLWLNYTDYLSEGHNQKFPYTCNHAVNISKKLEILRNKFTLATDSVTDLDPTTILKSYQLLFKNCTFGNKFTNGTSLFKFILFSLAGPKQLICEHRVTRAAFKFFVKDLETSYQRTRVEAGEPVGMIAAQSIGEPCTQLTLNSFHFAGAGRAQGVPRIKELMYLESGSRIGASSKIYIKAPHSIIKKDVEYIARNEIGATTIKDILTGYEIFFVQENSTCRDIRHYNNLKAQADIHESISSPYLLKLVFSHSDDQELVNTWRAIDKTPGKYNNVLDIKNKTIYTLINVYEVVAFGSKKDYISDKKVDFDISSIGDLIDACIIPIVISGTLSIRNPVVVENNMYSYDDILGSFHKSKSYSITASGTNLLELFKNPAVDSTMTISNNVLDMYDTFGIEVARAVLIEELHLVLKDVGDLDNRHISVLVDRMVGTGKLLGVNSKGMEAYDNGVLGKASFEKVVSILRDGGLHGQEDKIEGISANLMCGHAPPCGTGIVEVALDEEIIGKNNVFNKSLVKKNKIDKNKKNDTKDTKRVKNISNKVAIEFNID